MRTLCLFLLILIDLNLLFASSPCQSAGSDGPWWNKDWRDRQSLVLKSVHFKDKVGAFAEVILDTSELIRLEQLQPDARDLTFVLDLDSQQHPMEHSILSGLGTKTTKILLRVPILLRQPKLTRIYAYYDNSSVEIESRSIAAEELPDPSQPLDATASTWMCGQHSHRLPFYLNNPHDQERNDVLASLEIDLASFIAEGKMRPDLGDLRFTYFDPSRQRESLIQHHLESFEKGTARIHLTLDRLAAGTKSSNPLRSLGVHQFQEGLAFYKGKSYLAYIADGGTVAGKEDAAVHSIYVAVYDSALKEWRTPVKVDDMANHEREEENDHRFPTLAIDRQGYIHVIYGAHGSPLLYKRSSRPGDATSWVEMESPDRGRCTYPRLLVDDANRFYLFFRGDGSQDFSMRMSEDGGASWTPRRTLISGRGDKLRVYAGGVALEQGAQTAIHMAWSWANDRKGRIREKVMYAISRDGGATWSDDQGTPFSLPISREQLEGRRLVSQDEDRQVCDLALHQGRPRLLYVKRKGPTALFFAKLGEQGWEETRIGGDGVSWGRLLIDPEDGRYEIFAQLRRRFREAGRFLSLDEGKSWRDHQATSHSAESVGRFLVSRNGGPIKAAWVTADRRLPQTLSAFPTSYGEHPAGTVFLYFGNRRDEGGSAQRPFRFEDFEGSQAKGLRFEASGSEAWVGLSETAAWGGSGSSLELTDPGPGQAIVSSRFSAPSQVGGVVFQARFNENDSDHFPATLLEGEDEHLLVAARSNGRWGYRNAAGTLVDFPNSSPYSPGKWHQVEVYWDCSSGKFWVYVDRNSLTPKGLQLPRGCSAMTGWRAAASSHQGHGRMWIDNLTVDYRISTPALGFIRDLAEANPWKGSREYAF